MLYQLHFCGVLAAAAGDPARERSTATSRARTTTATTSTRWSRSCASASRVPIVHRAAVRPRARQAHAAGRRAGAAVGARRPSATLSLWSYGVTATSACARAARRLGARPRRAAPHPARGVRRRAAACPRSSSGTASTPTAGTRWPRTPPGRRSAAAACCPTATSGAWRCCATWRGRGVGAALLGAARRRARASRARARRAQRADAGAGVLRTAGLRGLRRRVRRGRHRAPRDGARPALTCRCSARPRGRNACRPRRLGVPSAANERSTNCALPSLSTAKHRRAARAVVVADDERRRQPPLPLQRDAGRRQLVVGRDGAVGEQRRASASSVVVAGGAPTPQRRGGAPDLGPGRVERGVGQPVDARRRASRGDAAAVRCPGDRARVAAQEIEAVVAAAAAIAVGDGGRGRVVAGEERRDQRAARAALAGRGAPVRGRWSGAPSGPSRVTPSQVPPA